MDADLTHSALRAIRRILRAADQGERRLALATGLTPSQLLVLQEVERSGDITPSEISQALQFSQATITNIVDRLENAALVVRRKGERDKRQIRVILTEKGQAMLTTAPDLLQNRFMARFGSLRGWEQAMILSSLERLGELLDAAEIDAAPLLDSGAIDRIAPNA